MDINITTLILLFIAFLVTIFSIIFLIRFFLITSLKVFAKFYLKSDDFSKKTEAKKLKKTEENLYRSKKKEQEQNYSKIQDLENSIDEVEIVDIVKPVGFWTSVVLGQKLTYLVSSAKLMNQNRKKGFWTSMVEAQGRAAGRERGKGRG